MAGETKRLRLTRASWRVDAFDPSVEGVAPITHEGTNVPSGKVREVEAAARKHGFAVSEVKEDA